MAENDDKDKRIRVQLELPPEIRAFGWALWWLTLGFCFGIAVHNLFDVLARGH